jgi:hypothetical protein
MLFGVAIALLAVGIIFGVAALGAWASDKAERWVNNEPGPSDRPSNGKALKRDRGAGPVSANTGGPGVFIGNQREDRA